MSYNTLSSGGDRYPNLDPFNLPPNVVPDADGEDVNLRFEDLTASPLPHSGLRPSIEIEMERGYDLRTAAGAVHEPDVLYLEQITVDPQGRGLGTLALSRVAHDAAAQGLNFIRCEVTTMSVIGLVAQAQQLGLIGDAYYHLGSHDPHLLQVPTAQFGTQADNISADAAQSTLKQSDDELQAGKDASEVAYVEAVLVLPSAQQH